MDPSFTVADWGHDASLRDTIRCVHSRRKIEGDHVVSNIFAYPECTTASNSPSTKYTDDEPGLRQLDDTGGTVLTGPPVRRSQVESPRPQNIVNKGLSEEGKPLGIPMVWEELRDVKTPENYNCVLLVSCDHHAAAPPGFTGQIIDSQGTDNLGTE